MESVIVVILGALLVVADQIVYGRRRRLKAEN